MDGEEIHLPSLQWPLKESRVPKPLAWISLHKSTLLLVITGDMIHDQEYQVCCATAPVALTDA